MKKLLAELPWLDETVVFQTHALLPDGVHQWDNADWSHKPAVMLPESLYCAALALPKDDPRGDEALFVARSVSHVDGDSNWNWLRVLVDDGARKGTDPRHGPTSYVAHGTGTVMARTAWNADAAWVAMNSGPPWGDYQHLDQGHFEVVRGADRLIVDPGAYDAYSTMSHNSLLIDDHKENIRWAPNQGVWGKAAGLPRSEDANGVVYAEADFGAAYDPDGYPQDNPERSVLRAERELVFSRTPLTGAHGTSARLVLYDRVTLAKTKYGVTWEMHTPVVPSVSANVATVGVGKSSVVVTTLLPVAKSAQLKEPTVHIDNMFEQNDVADGISSTRTEEESARGAIERRFLHVIAIGAAGDALPAAVHVDGEGAEGAAIDGETYVFPVAGPQKTAGALAWRSPPTASRQIVTGLAPGGHYTASAATAGDVCRVALKPGGPLAASAAGTLAIRRARLRDPLRDQGVGAFVEGEVALPEGELGLSKGDVAPSEGDVALSEGDVALSEGDVALSEGDIALSEGDLRMSACDFVLSEGEVVLSQGDLVLSLCEIAWPHANVALSQGDVVLSQGDHRMRQGDVAFGVDGPPFAKAANRTARALRLVREGAERRDRLLQPLANPDLRLVVEQLLRSAHVGQRVAHVPGARRAVLRLQRRSGLFSDDARQLVQRRAVAAGEVDHLPLELRRRRRRQEVRGDRVVDEAEVAGLLAVAVDDGGLTGERRGDEVRDDRGVLAVRVLARAEDVEVAERDRLHLWRCA